MPTAVESDVGVAARIERVRPAASLRILFLIDEISANAGGGTERQVLQLIRVARRLGYDPRVAVLRGSEWLNEEKAGCPVYMAGASSFFRASGWLGCLRLLRWMRRERLAVVQTFFIESNILGPPLARLAGVPVVISSRRNMNQWHGRTAWLGPAVVGLQRLANRTTDRIVSNSQVVADAMIATEQIPLNKVRVAYNGIDLERFSNLEPERLRVRRSLGIAEDQVLVGNISCMRPVKGIGQFVDAARILLERDPSLRFILVGDGPERERIRERIRRYGIEAAVHLVGEQVDVVPYLAAMDIGVLSSLGEGFSNSLLEYMAAGLPAVATEVGGNREALEETGVLVPPDNAEALAEAILGLRSPALRARLGAAARQRVERFSLGRAEKRMEEIYSETLEAKANRKTTFSKGK